MSEDPGSGASGTAEPQASALLGSAVREGDADIGDVRLHHDDVPNLDRVERLPDASHWVHHEDAERVTQLLIDFFAPALPAGNR